jgi:hypothetical protein
MGHREGISGFLIQGMQPHLSEPTLSARDPLIFRMPYAVREAHIA